MPSFARDGRLEALIVREVVLHVPLDEAGRDVPVHVARMAWHLVGSHITHFRTDDMLRLLAADGIAEAALVDESTPPLARGGDVVFHAFSGRTEAEVGPYSLRVLVRDGTNERSMSVRLTLPVELGPRAASESDELRDAVQRIVDVDAAIWGGAGLSVEYDERRSIGARNDRIRYWCARYEAIECSDFDHMPALSQACLPAVRWMNVLPAALRARCRDRLVSCGEALSLGDRHRGGASLEMCRIATMLRAHRCALTKPPCAFEADDYQAWVDRLVTKESRWNQNSR
jgi:hypothetical protein